MFLIPRALDKEKHGHELPGGTRTHDLPDADHGASLSRSYSFSGAVLI